MSHPPEDASSAHRLAAWFAAVIGLLIVYACLHPFTGWRDPALPPLGFLRAPLPTGRYLLWSDVVVNVLGTVPFSFALVPALRHRLGRFGAPLVAVLLTFSLSLGLETLQNYLPSRVPSNLDVATNTLGGLLGALAGIRWGHTLFAPGRGISRWREHFIIPGHLGDVGLVLLLSWLLTQLTSDNLLFASGDLRRLFDLPTALPFSPQRFMKVESAIVACQLVAVGLTTRVIQRHFSPWPILLLPLAALGLRSLVDGAVFYPGDALHWATQGGQTGLALGGVLLAICLLLPRFMHGTLAGLALLVGTALVNLAPDNPFLPHNIPLPRQGNALNFLGLTQLTASLWPFLTFVYLGLLGSRMSASKRAPFQR
ncbi:VanZ family protein [Zoogloea sp.]|uniref:VanZ family protein n=1 Tax=Zoogloea sp. TaxID=49181 RepID=UPI0035B2D066